MLIRLNFRNVVATFLAMTLASPSHANTVGNITCGPDNSPGERVVCDYAIIGLKYQRLIDSQFSNGRRPDVEAEVKKNVAACEDLHCVEVIIDSQMASPVVEQTTVAPLPRVTNIPKPSIASEITSVSIGPIDALAKKEEPKPNSIAAILFVLFLVFLLFWIIFRKRAAPSKGKSQPTEVGWFSLFLAFLVKEAEKTPSQEGNKVDVTIKPYGGLPFDGFEWDGEVLRPYGRSSSDGWEFTDRIFKRYGQSSSEGYEWDGTFLRPCGKSLSDGYEWDGRILKPYGKSSSDGHELDGNNMKPYGKSSSEGWEATGPIPIPVWAHVLGLIS